MTRRPVPTDHIWAAAQDVYDKMKEVLSVKGDGAFSSTHEMLGTITEEFHELVDAVRSNDPDNVQHELKDLAVLAIFSLACFKVNNLK